MFWHNPLIALLVKEDALNSTIIALSKLKYELFFIAECEELITKKSINYLARFMWNVYLCFSLKHDLIVQHINEEHKYVLNH
jgi:hypothetical protein